MFGATYRKQGDAYGRIVGEEAPHTMAQTQHSWKRWQDVTLVCGLKPIDASKDETFNKFDTADDQINREIDEYELESGKNSVIQLMLRYAFNTQKVIKAAHCCLVVYLGSMNFEKPLNLVASAVMLSTLAACSNNGNRGTK